MQALGELSIESLNKLDDVIVQLEKAWDDRLDLLRPKLVKRYLAGRLRLYLKLRTTGLESDATEYVAVWGGAYPLRLGQHRKFDRPITVCLRVCDEHLLDVSSVDADHERPVLVSIIEISQDAQSGIVWGRTSIGLYRANDIFRRGRDALYVTQSGGFEFGVITEDRELSVPSRGLGVGSNKSPDQMVQC